MDDLTFRTLSIKEWQFSAASIRSACCCSIPFEFILAESLLLFLSSERTELDLVLISFSDARSSANRRLVPMTKPLKASNRDKVPSIREALNKFELFVRILATIAVAPMSENPNIDFPVVNEFIRNIF